VFRLFSERTKQSDGKPETQLQPALPKVVAFRPPPYLPGARMSVLDALSAFAFVVVTTFAADAHAQASEASALSALPIGALSAAPVVVFASGVNLTVSAVEASAAGTTWVLERAADGARASVKLAGGVSVAVGTSIAVTAVAAGYVLSIAGQAVAFVPNEVGASLLYNERVTR
jgi:hypothetical protein